MKTCYRCKIEKDHASFDLKKSAKDGLQIWCKQCKKDSYQANKVQVAKRQKIYRAEHKEEIAFRKSEWAKLTRAERRQKWQAWHADNREEYNAKRVVYSTKRKQTDPMYRLAKNLRRRLHHAFKADNKSKKTTELLGCSIEMAFEHLQSQFAFGMNWENYGKWHVDHIIPLSSASTAEEMEKLCHYTNLQPLWASDNLKKSDKILNMQKVF